MRADPSIISVMGLSADAPAIAAFMHGPSSVAAPPVYLLRPFLRSQSRAQPISDARMYVMPGTGTGGGAGPKQGIANGESQLRKEQPNADPAANRPALTRNERRSIKCVDKLSFFATVSSLCLSQLLLRLPLNLGTGCDAWIVLGDTQNSGS